MTATHRTHYADDRVTIHHGDALDVLRELPDASVDAVCTDPPYGISFMGKEWDAPGKATRATTTAADKAANPYGRARAEIAAYTGDAATASRAFQDWCLEWATECLRVLKPGGHLLAFGGTRTWHRLACAVEDAGFEVRDSIAWLYGSGFPKSLDVSKAIDKAAGAQRTKVVGKGRAGGRSTLTTGNPGRDSWRDARAVPHDYDITAPATPDAERWQGWGTALKPSHEPVVVARKPLIGTIAQNVLTYGTGALNIDACRISASGQSPAPATSQGAGGSSRGDNTTCTCPAPADDQTTHSQSTQPPASSDASRGGRSGRPSSARGRESGRPQPQGSQDGYPSSPRSGDGRAREAGAGDQASPQPRPDAHTSPARCATCGRNRSTQSMPYPHDTTPHVQREATRAPAGRWPTNVVLDDSQAAELDRQSGERSPGARPGNTARAPKFNGATYNGGKVYDGQVDEPRQVLDGGSASRFFPTFRYEAKAPKSERPKVNGVAHPTVKPLDLMRWLVRLVTPPGGTVLEPFAGSGTTVEACLVEGFRCIAIEREADYLPLIMQRVNRRRDPVAYIQQAGEDLGLFDLEGEGA